MVKLFFVTLATVFLLGYINLSHQMMPPPPDFCWTEWFNGDYPRAVGDYETLEKLRIKYPGQICARPRGIQAVTAEGFIPAEETLQKIYAYNTNIGFICRNKDQKKGICFDYQVRFYCPCAFPIQE